MCENLNFVTAGKFAFFSFILVACGLTTKPKNADLERHNSQDSTIPPADPTPPAPNPTNPNPPATTTADTSPMVTESTEILSAITVPVRFTPKPFADSTDVKFKCVLACEGDKTVDEKTGAFVWKTASTQASGEFPIELGAFRGEKQIGRYQIKVTFSKWEPIKRYDIKGSHASAYLGYITWIGDFDGDKKDDFIAYEAGGTVGTTTYPYQLSIYKLNETELQVTKTFQNSNRYGDLKLLYSDANGAVVLVSSYTNKEVKAMNISTGATVFSVTSNANRFAYRTCVLGDINDDGIVDFAISTSGKRYDASTDEKVEIYDGSSRAILHTFTETADDIGYGASLACGADFTGDGKNDIAIGADWVNLGGTELGSVFVYDLQSKNRVFRINGSEDIEHFGRDISFTNDLDGDKKAELLIGSPFASGGGTKRGKVTIVSSKLKVLKVINGEEDNSEFNKPTSIGDINADGIDDFLICAETANQGGTWRGKIFIYNGADLGLLYSLAGDFDQGQFGERHTPIFGDINGDGKKDILVGNTFHSENSGDLKDIGRVNVLISP